MSPDDSYLIGCLFQKSSVSFACETVVAVKFPARWSLLFWGNSGTVISAVVVLHIRSTSELKKILMSRVHFLKIWFNWCMVGFGGCFFPFVSAAHIEYHLTIPLNYGFYSSWFVIHFQFADSNRAWKYVLIYGLWQKVYIFSMLSL